MVLGVAEHELGAAFAESLRDGGVERALVVCGAEGLDEISCAGDTLAWQLVDGVIAERRLHPSLFGLKTHPLSEVASGTPAENAETLKMLLTSGEAIPGLLTPVLDFVLMNAAALLVISGLAGGYEEGAEMAKESITSGKAWAALETFRRASRDEINK